ncbi:hypothetical protein AYI69_g9245, partial [Smittium culicis]
MRYNIISLFLAATASASIFTETVVVTVCKVNNLSTSATNGPYVVPTSATNGPYVVPTSATNGPY